MAYWADQVAPLVGRPIGSTTISLTRAEYAESLIGDLVTDGMLSKADQYDDDEINGSVNAAFTNAAGLRADIEIPPGATLPYTLTWGDTFNVMPFGNTLFLMDLTGAQIQVLLDGAARQPRSMQQNAGVRWSRYNDCGCDAPTVWGAYGVQINGKPLEYAKTYRIVTNNYAAAYGILADGTNCWDTYYDIQEAVNEYIAPLSPIEASDIVTGRINRLEDPQPNLISSQKSFIDADGDGIAQAGETLTYTITISNSGEWGAGLLLTDTLPGGLAYVEGSLSIAFPGTGFTATVVDNVLTAQTENGLNPSPASALPIESSAVLTYVAQVSSPLHAGDQLLNTIELVDQFAAYAVPPAVIPLEPRPQLFLSFLLRSTATP